MATTVATLRAERWLDEILLAAALPALAAGAPLSELVALPAGLGDVAIMSVLIRATTIDSLPPETFTPKGVEVLVFSANEANAVDYVGCAQWLLTSDTATANRMDAFIDPDALCLWRQDEKLTVTSPELDDDATPTGIYEVLIKVVRVRPQEGTAFGPIRLVR